MKVLVTGGAGFIGSAVVRLLVSETDAQVCNVDKLTYAGNLESLKSIENSPQYQFVQADICDRESMQSVFESFCPTAVLHLAAESHVDRSIHGPAEFIHTNVIGTYTLLEVARSYWSELPTDPRDAFRFHHVSTDEVYGDLGRQGLFRESTPYAPSSPYSASKASSDHLVSAWQRTYGLPTLITNCSNNYGPYQFPEKLIPLVILNALRGERLPVYGDGCQVRDWLYVDDHARALYRVLAHGEVGETYNIGGHNEWKNIDVVKFICATLDELYPSEHREIDRYEKLITFVEDRPGHDQRYAIDASKIDKELGWQPMETFETGIRKTVEWYLANSLWVKNVTSGAYRDWMKVHYQQS